MASIPPVETASEADRLFFAAHPGRRYRLRAMIDGEMPPCPPAPAGWERFVATWRAKPGMRVRLPFAGSHRIPDTEQNAKRAFEAVRDNDPYALARLAAENLPAPPVANDR